MRPFDALSTGRIHLAQRLQDYALKGLEGLLCFILLDKREREMGRRASAANGSPRFKTPEPASAYLGHGRLSLFDADASASDPFLNQPALGPKAACEVLVLGHGALVDDLLDRIRAEGARTNARSVARRDRRAHSHASREKFGEREAPRPLMFA